VALWHHEGHVARKRATGRYHLDFTSGGARRYGGRDFGTRYHDEFSCRAVKRDAGGAGQVRSQNHHGRSHLAGSGQRFHERARAHNQGKDRAIAAGPAKGGHAVESPVGGLITIGHHSGPLNQPQIVTQLSSVGTGLVLLAIDRDDYDLALYPAGETNWLLEQGKVRFIQTAWRSP
jgi:hypothetical protein